MNVLKMSKQQQTLLLFHANSFYTRLRGLIGRPLYETTGLVLSPCNQIHTCFMQYPIDAIFMSDENKVLYIEENMKPFQFGRRYRDVKKVLELKSGATRQLNIKIGDTLNLEKTDYSVML